MAKMRNYLKFMLAAGLAFGLFFGIGSGITSFLKASNHTDIIPDEEEIVEKQEGKRTNILVLGVDARPGEDQSRSDTMMLVSIDPKLNKVAVISIPRDTKARIKGSTNKIAAANFIGGPELAVTAVEELLDTKIDNYITVDFNGFKEIINTLGGVTVTVPQRMYKPSEDIDLNPGTQKLNGRQALALVRYREYTTGDIQRTAQQQEFIKALAAEVLKPATITKLPKLIKQTNQYVETDLGISTMLRIASWAPGFTADSVVTQTLPGYFYDELDSYGNLAQSYWIADSKQINNLIENLFAGKSIAVVTGSAAPVYIAPPVEEEKEEMTDDETDNEQQTEKIESGRDRKERSRDETVKGPERVQEEKEESGSVGTGIESDRELPEKDPDKSADQSVGRSDQGGAPEAVLPAGNINTGPEGYI
jgi:LCP family protein required for cell wall assembly